MKRLSIGSIDHSKKSRWHSEREDHSLRLRELFLVNDREPPF